jgi:hypothetical protein
VHLRPSQGNSPWSPSCRLPPSPAAVGVRGINWHCVIPSAPQDDLGAWLEEAFLRALAGTVCAARPATAFEGAALDAGAGAGQGAREGQPCASRGQASPAGAGSRKTQQSPPSCGTALEARRSWRRVVRLRLPRSSACLWCRKWEWRWQRLVQQRAAKLARLLTHLLHESVRLRPGIRENGTVSALRCPRGNERVSATLTRAASSASHEPAGAGAVSAVEVGAGPAEQACTGCPERPAAASNFRVSWACAGVGHRVHTDCMRVEFLRLHVSLQVAVEAGLRWRHLREQAAAGGLKRAPARFRKERFQRPSPRVSFVSCGNVVCGRATDVMVEYVSEVVGQMHGEGDRCAGADMARSVR